MTSVARSSISLLPPGDTRGRQASPTPSMSRWRSEALVIAGPDVPRAADVCLRPAQVCRGLLAALDASDGRRRARKRDQTPDAIGLAAKRELLERAVRDDPD